ATVVNAAVPARRRAAVRSIAWASPCRHAFLWTQYLARNVPSRRATRSQSGGYHARARATMLSPRQPRRPTSPARACSRRLDALNRFDRTPPMAGEAEVKYLDGDFRVIRPGAFVRCAVTGTPIPLEELK